MTPIQQAIVEIAQSSDGGKNKAYAEAIVILRRLLPKEKEFVGKVWDAAVKWEVEDGWIQIEESAPPPDKQQFLNQLYPEK